MDGPVLLGGRYELRHVLGFGGMAEVRDGWDTRLQRPVAVKLLHPGMSSQADIRDRFKVEACAAAGLNHPNIVAVHDFGDHDGTPFIVMERLPGDTLADLIAVGQMPQSQVHSALASVLAGLAAAHSTGMLHRDIKPGNILLTTTGSVKVADFGIAKTPGAVHTTTGQIIGTLAYLSPERVSGNPASFADDLYAAGVVGYEALTGRRPFLQEEIAPLAHAILEEQPPPLAVLRPDVDPALANVVERAMSRDPLQRFESADAMRAALTGAGQQQGNPAVMSPPPRSATRVFEAPPVPAGPMTIRPAPRSRVRKLVGAAAIVVAMAVAALAFALNSPSTTVPSTPEPEAVSTSLAPPVSTTAAPVPVSQAPAPLPVVEQASEPPEHANDNNGNNGNNGNGNGHGNGRKPK